VIAYVPDRVFVEELKRVDPQLIVKWHKHLQRWCIYRMIKELVEVYTRNGLRICQMKNSPEFIMRVENDDKSYRPLDGRTILELHKRDSFKRARSIKEFYDIQDERAKALRERMRLQAKDERIRQLKDIPKKNWEVIWDNMAHGRDCVPAGMNHIYGVK